MKIRKAIVTAAGRQQRSLPLQTFVDRQGRQVSALRLSVDEALSAGVEEVAVVICPGDREPYAAAAGDAVDRIRFVEQVEPRGYGHALLCARGFAADEPFLHLVGDHLYVSRSSESCADQVARLASGQSCSVSAVQPTRESMLPFYGVVGGRREPAHPRVYEIEHVVEKPTPTEAEQTLHVPGLRAGHYLCFFGIHVLTPAIMDILEELAARDGPVGLSPALDLLARRERYLALEVEGCRHNIGVKYGLLVAQLALSLSGRERDEVLAQLVELLAQYSRTTPAA